MDAAKLGPLSRDFARTLFVVHPEWRAFARFVPVDGGELGALEVQVPAPMGSDLRGPLIISTEGGEITVHFDSWHGHYRWPPEEGGGLGSGDPLALVADILAERLLAVSTYLGDP